MNNSYDIDLESINTIRCLSIDAIQKSNSGHPGLPLGAAPLGYTLWYNHLRITPTAPNWPDRDRFILSAGHGSMLQYALMNLANFPEISLEELKNFRQWQSKTPGHPEYKHTAGVDTTTGPLGQGIANGVGMAIAERKLAAYFNKSDLEIVNHFTYVVVGDGCLMEGISAEACSLAGHLKLGKLIVLYDANNICLDGPISETFTENVAQRYQSYGWQVITVEDGNTDITGIDIAIQNAKLETQKPSIIIVKTTIGYGSPNKNNTSSAHGAPLGEEEVALTKQALGFDPKKSFFVSQKVRDHFHKLYEKNADLYQLWQQKLDLYSQKYPQLFEEWNAFLNLELPDDWDQLIPEFTANSKEATRSSNHKILNAIAKKVNWIFGGDADLSCSTKTFIKDAKIFDGQTGEGRNIKFGVREHAMGAIANGIFLHGGLKPFTGTFFSFVDYMRPAIRLASLCEIAPLFIFTHDSLAVGEDGPTHQPVEQLMSIRSMPNLDVYRPADSYELKYCWKTILENKNQPAALILTRQNVLNIDRNKYASAKNTEKGAYILSDTENPKAVIMATGSEIELALDVCQELNQQGIKTRVISMPSWELFERQSAEYKQKVLLPEVKYRISIEAGVTFGWEKYTGLNGLNIGVDQFGASAPSDIVLDEYGFSKDKIIQKIKKYLSSK